MKLVRPTKEMMLAINAQLEGDNKLADSLVREHGLDRREMAARIDKRGGEKYTFSNRGGRKGGRKRGPKGKQGRVIAEATAPARDVASLIDRRTKTATLIQLEARIEEILAERNGRDVGKIRDAMKNIMDLRRKLQAAEQSLEV